MPFSELMEVLIMDLHRGPVPGLHLARFFQQLAQLDPNTPLAFGRSS
ncbi:MAG: hypothetical protein ACXWPS_08985 [Ktedonobacteraceae bacterium]